MTHDDSIRDIVTDGVAGFIVPQKCNGFGEKIAVLADNEALRFKMGKTGYDNHKNFTLSIFETHFLQALLCVFRE